MSDRPIPLPVGRVAPSLLSVPTASTALPTPRGPAAAWWMPVCQTPGAQILTGPHQLCPQPSTSLGWSFRRWVSCCHARLPTSVMHCRVQELVQGGKSRAGNTTKRRCKFLSAGATHSQALITAVLQGPAWRGWIPGSGQAPRASRAPKTALMYFDRT